MSIEIPSVIPTVGSSDLPRKPEGSGAPNILGIDPVIEGVVTLYPELAVYPELRVYAAEKAKFSPLKLVDGRVAGYTAFIQGLGIGNEIMVTRLDMERCPDMDLDQVRVQIQNALAENAGRNSSKPVSTFIVDMLGEEVVSGGNTNQVEVLKGLGFDHTETAAVNNIVMNWDISPAGAKILRLTTCGPMTSVAAIRLMYQCRVKEVLKDMERRSGVDGSLKISDIVDFTHTAGFYGLGILGHSISFGGSLTKYMPPARFGVGGVIKHGDKTGTVAQFLDAALAKLNTKEYPIRFVTEDTEALRIIDGWHREKF